MLNRTNFPLTDPRGKTRRGTLKAQWSRSAGTHWPVMLARSSSSRTGFSSISSPSVPSWATRCSSSCSSPSWCGTSTPMWGRQLIVVWAWVLFLGQSTKDVVRWTRPASPPVVKVEVFYNTEYSMPSTHAMTGTALPFSLFLLTCSRWQVWCTLQLFHTQNQSIIVPTWGKFTVFRWSILSNQFPPPPWTNKQLFFILEAMH